MRTLTIAMLVLAGIMLSTLTHAQTVNICERTEQVRDAILEAVSTDDCAAVDAEDLVGITSLDLERTGISDLKAGDFDGLTGLIQLDLKSNQLTTLPAGVFDGLSSLVNLHLSSNRLTTLPPGVFDGLNSLSGLFLSQNRLTTLPDGLFDGLSSLRQLVLAWNRLEGLMIDDELFAMLGDGVQVDLENQERKVVANIHLWLADSQSALGRQSFVRIQNFGEEVQTIRVTATDDSGYSPENTVDVALAAYQAIHFNSGDLVSPNESLRSY